MSSVCLSVTFRYRDQIGWNSSKIISRPNSLRSMRSLTPNMGDLVQREHLQNWGGIRVGSGAGSSFRSYSVRAVAPKRCKIGPRLLLRTNRKSQRPVAVIFLTVCQTPKKWGYGAPLSKKWGVHVPPTMCIAR